MAPFDATWGIVSSRGDSNLAPDGLTFQLNGHSQKECTLGVELLGQIIAPLHFKTERVAEATLRPS